MAIGDIKVFGKTNANVNADVLVETNDRIAGDTTLTNDINNNIIGNISHTNAQILDEQVPVLTASLTSAVNDRKSKLGDPVVETISGGVTFASKFNTIKARTLTSETNANAASGNFSGVKAKYNTLLTTNNANTAALNDIKSGSPTYNTLRTAEDYIVGLKTSEDSTLAGYTTTTNAQLNALADGGQQTKTNGMVYKDENSNTYYRLYIYAGNLQIEEVAAPL
jgi:hypothetical protein